VGNEGSLPHPAKGGGGPARTLRGKGPGRPMQDLDDKSLSHASPPRRDPRGRWRNAPTEVHPCASGSPSKSSGLRMDRWFSGPSAGPGPSGAPAAFVRDPKISMTAVLVYPSDRNGAVRIVETTLSHTQSILSPRAIPLTWFHMPVDIVDHRGSQGHGGRGWVGHGRGSGRHPGTG
jgi:hypothetical protein